MTPHHVLVLESKFLLARSRGRHHPNPPTSTAEERSTTTTVPLALALALALLLMLMLQLVVLLIRQMTSYKATLCVWPSKSPQVDRIMVSERSRLLLQLQLLLPLRVSWKGIEG